MGKYQLLTVEQKWFIFIRKIKVGKMYSFPPTGFSVYRSPSYESKEFDLELNPFFRSLAHELFMVHAVQGDFVRVNFVNKPRHADWWMSMDEVLPRPMIPAIILFLLCLVPCALFNLCKYLINGK